METTKARVEIDQEYSSVVPILIPDLDDVRQVGWELHRKGEAWQGVLFGWQAEYNPELAAPPLDSSMTYTPADFCIGESGIWFFSMMWEHGSEQGPVEFLDDRGIVQEK
ncbi:MAG TPA: hypothetical protein EYH05_10620 [Anaerolineae bacterium]|nr:hypothetical protein [Anaerolineae bacterium]